MTCERLHGHEISASVEQLRYPRAAKSRASTASRKDSNVIAIRFFSCAIRFLFRRRAQDGALPWTYEANPGGYQYTAFCDRYREFQKRRGLVMRQIHTAGDKLFVDYSGKKARLTDPKTSEVIEVELFVAVLGARTTRTRKRPIRSK